MILIYFFISFFFYSLLLFLGYSAWWKCHERFFFFVQYNMYANKWKLSLTVEYLPFTGFGRQREAYWAEGWGRAGDPGSEGAGRHRGQGGDFTQVVEDWGRRWVGTMCGFLGRREATSWFHCPFALTHFFNPLQVTTRSPSAYSSSQPRFIFILWPLSSLRSAIDSH